MISKLGQIMLYVNDQDEALRFWTERVGFTVVAEEDSGQGMRWVEIAATEQSETSIVLHNKELVSKMQPELHLGTPSLLFFSDNLEQLRDDFIKQNITVGEIVNMGSRKVFNFADSESNYFAVMEK